jgi:hypothetical protein
MCSQDYDVQPGMNFVSGDVGCRTYVRIRDLRVLPEVYADLALLSRRTSAALLVDGAALLVGGIILWRGCCKG